MNKTKFGLIIAAIVLNICSIALNIYLLIRNFVGAIKNHNVNINTIFFGIYEILGIIAFLIATGLLIYAIADKGIHFRGRNSYYMSAVLIIFILNTFSIPSILLLITLFIPDIVWVKPHDDVYFKPVDATDPAPEKPKDKDRDRKIAELRRLKDEGKITQEEFNQELFKLL